MISGNVQTGGGAGLHYCHGTIQNNIISNNSSEIYGGGLLWCYGPIRSNTIWGNSAGELGGGLYDCHGIIQNNIIFQNIAPIGPQLYECSEPPNYCCIEGWSGGGTGNILDDPQFVDADNGDFHLKPTSPCIDAGRFIPDLTYDFEGHRR
jgi:hypothetical protein